MTEQEIRILLIQNDVKQIDIANSLGVSRAAVSRVIQGISTSSRIKNAIAKAVKKGVLSIWPESNPKNIAEIEFVLIASERAWKNETRAA